MHQPARPAPPVYVPQRGSVQCRIGPPVYRPHNASIQQNPAPGSFVHPGSVVQRNGQSVLNIVAGSLNADDLRNTALVSTSSLAEVTRIKTYHAGKGRIHLEGSLRTLGALDVQAEAARNQLRTAMITRYGQEEIKLIKRNGATLISADRIVNNLRSVLDTPDLGTPESAAVRQRNLHNLTWALQQLVSSTPHWGSIKLQGKSRGNAVPNDRDGLKAALGTLATANSEGALKGALGEIHDATFFASRFGARVAMDQTKAYSRLIPGQYLDTEKSKQVDLVFSQNGFTYYVETKFDVKTAIGKHVPNLNKKELAARADRVRTGKGLGTGEPVKVAFPAEHPLAKLPEVSQQLLGYEAAAIDRAAKQKRVVRIVSVPNSAGWLRFFTGTPSTAGLYIQLGWHLRIGTVVLSPDDLKRVQKKVFQDVLLKEDPTYQERNNPKNRAALEDYANRNWRVTPEEYMSA